MYLHLLLAKNIHDQRRSRHELPGAELSGSLHTQWNSGNHNHLSVWAAQSAQTRRVAGPRAQTSGLEGWSAAGDVVLRCPVAIVVRILPRCTQSDSDYSIWPPDSDHGRHRTILVVGHAEACAGGCADAMDRERAGLSSAWSDLSDSLCRGAFSRRVCLAGRRRRRYRWPVGPGGRPRLRAWLAPRGRIGACLESVRDWRFNRGRYHGFVDFAFAATEVGVWCAQ